MRYIVVLALALLGACASDKGSPYYKVENDKVVTYHYKNPAATCPHKNTVEFESVGCGTRCVRRKGVECQDCGAVISSTIVGE